MALTHTKPHFESPEIVAGTNQAAGVEISEVVPSTRAWTLYAVFFRLVTSATVANRRPHLVIDDGNSNIIFRSPAGAVQAASATVDYAFCNTNVRETAVTDGVLMAPMPALILHPGWRVRTITTAIQAGDDFGAPSLLVVTQPIY